MEAISIMLHKAVMEVNKKEVSEVEVTLLYGMISTWFPLLFFYCLALRNSSLHFRASKPGKQGKEDKGM